MSPRTLRAGLFASALFICLGLFGGRQVQAATCTILTDTVVDQAYITSGSCTAINIAGNVSTTWIGTVDLQGSGTVTVKTGNTMTLGVSSIVDLGTTDDFVVETGATVTHVATDPVGIQIDARSITVDAGGVINSTSLGCEGGSGYLDNGDGPNLTTGVCAVSTAGYGTSGNSGGSQGTAAAHGGVGGPGGAGGSTITYGSSTRPTLLGSGGGSGYFAVGGNGGGRIMLTASNSLTIDGTIAANGTGGGNGGSYGGGGGGSGGSILLSAGTLAGAGAIQAIGGNGGPSSSGGLGGGGGGRISIGYATLSFSGTSSTAGGLTAPGLPSGSAGTIYALQYTAPTAPTLTTPLPDSYNASRNPLLAATSYVAVGGTHLSTDWKVTTDAIGASMVWSSLGDTDDLTSITVNTSKGTFSGSLVGQTSLVASTTYYGFVRYTNAVGASSWSSASLFRTAYVGTSSTLTLAFDDVAPATSFDYNSTNVEINASGNGYARLKDLGGASYPISSQYIGWTKRQAVTITNANASPLNSFQVKVPVTYDSDMQTDFDDIRFTAEDGVTDLPYWLETKTNGASATFWVRIPSLAASSATTIHMYYGNGGASSLSNGAATFEYFDDFNDGDITNWKPFTVHGPAPATSTFGGAMVLSGSGIEGGVYSTDYTFTNGVVEVNMIFDQRTGPGQDFYIGARGNAPMANFYRFGPYWGGSNEAGIAIEAGHSQLQFAAYDYGNDVWRKISFRLNGTSLAGSFDDTQHVATTNGSYSSGYIGFGMDALHENTTNMSLRLDDLRVRQYAALSPSASFGSEMNSAPFASIVFATAAGGDHPAYAQLYRFEEILMPGSTGSIQYQLSHNGTTWKYWNGSAWVTASDALTATNSSSTVNSYLPLFASQVGAGDLYVRAALVSDGSQPIGLDSLTFFYQPSNLDPSAPTSLGPTSLVNGSTTGTNNPILNFTLVDPDVADTVRYTIQIDDSSDFSSPVIDYTSELLAQGPASFQVGQATGTGTYAVGLGGQTLADGVYYWRVRTVDNSAVVSAYTLANSGAVAFIVDATPHYLSFLNATESGLESVTASSVRILLSPAHFDDVTVSYAITAGTADGLGVDYTLVSGVTTIAAGQTSTTIPFTVIDDAIDEPNETFTVTLSSPTYAIIGSNTSTVYTIVDNDTGAITFSRSALSLTEGAADSYTVVLTTAPTSTVEVLLTAGSEVTLSTSTIVFTSTTYATPVTVTVTAPNDTTYTGNRSVSILHTASTTANGYTNLSLSSISVSILEDDPQSGGGAAGSGGGGAPSSIFDLIAKTSTTPAVITPPVSEPTPIILVRGEPTPVIPPAAPDAPVRQIITILNPSDVLSLVQATQSSRDFEKEGRSLGLVRKDAKEFRVTLTDARSLSLSNFITYGISERTVALGEGERRALVRDALETMKTGDISPADLERMSRGIIPNFRNLTNERVQLPRVRSTFRSIFGHDPDFKKSEENLAWNTLMYRIRFSRNLAQEKEGILEFKTLFKRAPQDPFQWAAVRVLGYIQR